MLDQDYRGRAILLTASQQVALHNRIPRAELTLLYQPDFSLNRQETHHRASPPRAKPPGEVPPRDAAPARSAASVRPQCRRAEGIASPKISSPNRSRYQACHARASRAFAGRLRPPQVMRRRRSQYAATAAHSRRRHIASHA